MPHAVVSALSVGREHNAHTFGSVVMIPSLWTVRRGGQHHALAVDSVPTYSIVRAHAPSITVLAHPLQVERTGIVLVEELALISYTRLSVLHVAVIRA